MPTTLGGPPDDMLNAILRLLHLGCWVTSAYVPCHLKIASSRLLDYICTVQVPKYNPLVNVCYAFVSVAHPQRK